MIHLYTALIVSVAVTLICAWTGWCATWTEKTK